MKTQPLLGIISDTHEEIERTRRAYETLARRGVERVVHCGDVGPTSNLRFPESATRPIAGDSPFFLQIPIDFVFGNCDRRGRESLARFAENPENGVRSFGDFGEIEWRGKRVFWTHGHLSNSVEDAAYSGEYDLICRGHSHRFEQKTLNDALILNPGAIQSRGEPPCCCVVDENLKVERIFL